MVLQLHLSPNLSGQPCLFLIEVAVRDLESPKSMRFLESIQGHTILILVDSGSSHTFINASVAAQLARISSLDHYLIV
jgi:hypothetical protein